eukprot:5315485-Pleurochrysis_carterae.AAC.1
MRFSIPHAGNDMSAESFSSLLNSLARNSTLTLLDLSRARRRFPPLRVSVRGPHARRVDRA